MLSDKQKRFCDEYLIDFNATQAAKRAGYSSKTATEQGSRLLINVNVAEYLNSKNQKISNKLEISAERTKLEIARIAYQDARQFYDEAGNLIPVHELSDDAAAALASLEEDELFEWRDGVKSVIGVTKKIKRYDKTKALEMLAKIDKLYTDGPVTNFSLNGKKVVFK